MRTRSAPGTLRTASWASPTIRYAKLGEHQYVGRRRATWTSRSPTSTELTKSSSTRERSSSGSITASIAAQTAAALTVMP